MKKIIISIIILIIAAVAAYYFVFKNLSGTETENYNTATTTDTMMSESSQTDNRIVSTTSISVDIAIPKNAAITIKNFAFSPSSMTISKGSKVTWTNEDSAPHTVTSDSGTVLNSATLHSGDSFSFTFNTAGTFTYYCSIHPMMKGTVIVE